MNKLFSPLVLFLAVLLVAVPLFLLLTSDPSEPDESAGYIPGPPPLPVKGEGWIYQRGFGLWALELDHGWIVRINNDQRAGMTFVPRPREEQ
jgi:hypothetical protein